MPIGPVRYDKECEQVFKSTNANTVILMVLGGEKGSGFSVVSGDPDAVNTLPMLLTEMAHKIENDLAQQNN